MDIKNLNEQLGKIIETQIEGGDELQQVLDGTWTEEEGNTLPDVIVPRLDELTEEQLIQILNNAYKLDMSNGLFPSGWNSDKFGPYPVKLAQALSKSEDSENLTDIYNVYYANRDEDTFRDAMEVWKDRIMSGEDEKLDHMLQAIGDEEDDAVYDAHILLKLSKDHGDLVEFLIEHLEEINPQLAEQTRQEFLGLQDSEV